MNERIERTNERTIERTSRNELCTVNCIIIVLFPIKVSKLDTILLQTKTKFPTFQRQSLTMHKRPLKLNKIDFNFVSSVLVPLYFLQHY